MIFIPSRWGKVFMSHKIWDNLKCVNCNIPMELKSENEYEEIKKCSKCGRKEVFIKKLRKEQSLKGEWKY